MASKMGLGELLSSSGTSEATWAGCDPVSHVGRLAEIHVFLEEVRPRAATAAEERLLNPEDACLERLDTVDASVWVVVRSFGLTGVTRRPGLAEYADVVRAGLMSLAGGIEA